MIRPSTTAAPIRPGWERHATSDALAMQMGRRRWRILQATRPNVEPSEAVPQWIRTPEQFADWLSVRVGVRELRAYFLDIEEIARQACDLELLRFARRYLGRSPKKRRG